MTASSLNQTLFTTWTPLPPSNSQPPEWDAVAVYGLVFGLLAVLLAFPGTYLAVAALRRHREHEARENTMNNLEGVIERQGSGMGGDIDITFENAASVEVDRLDGDAGK
ncbi:hypothetical protein NA56DRAFT_686365 [Hyaloscypha hepaticicola]|uniref:Uncharacterized protein n=1 Tax=Hyaloscypha hepaticicola TaxID=2082293 RepID=A0A2J6QFH8_9HELO|nr:hypothetical protein NA56DRAFT_686365 [Hyaloscypha hepaticicola]